MPILLLDGYNLLFRAFTTLPRSITAPDGQPINGMYGFLGTMMRLARDAGARKIVAAFDVPDEPTFRHRLYAGYQAQRGPLGGEHAAEFAQQAEALQRILPRLGVAALAKPGYEADDIIGTLGWRVAETEDEALIVSTDRDLFQLVRPGVRILVPGSNPLPIDNAEAVEAALRVPPEGVPTYKALAGDSSDNIPGVAGIGAKTAAALVTRFRTLDAIYQHLDELPPRVARNLEADRENAFLFRTIVTVVTDLDLPAEVADLPEPSYAEDAKPRQILESLNYGAS